jgi:hypothetical protein
MRALRPAGNAAGLKNLLCARSLDSIFVVDEWIEAAALIAARCNIG